MFLTRPRRMLTAVLAVILPFCAACQSRPAVPTHDWQDFRTALRIMDERNQSIENVSTAFDLTIRQPDGKTATLEGAMVAQRPDYTRLQAWRFHREVMDLTRRPEGTWLWTAERVVELEAQFAHPQANGVDWFHAMFLSPDPATAELVRGGSDTESLVVRWPLADTAGWTARAEIDRPTLTMREMEVFDDVGDFVQRVMFSDYRLVGETVFPMRLVAEGRWNVTLRSHDVTLNSDLPRDVFQPPAKAKRQD